MRGLAVLAFLAFVLSGCSGNGGSTEDDELSDQVPAPVPPPPPVPTTDTLWLDEDLAMSLAMPTSSFEEPMPVDGFLFFPSGGTQGPGAGVWTYDLAAPGNVTGALVHVWIEVVEQTVNPPHAPPPTPGATPQCTWQADFSIQFAGSAVVEATDCVVDTAPVIDAGVIELTFEFEFDGSVALEGSNTVVVALTREPYSLSPNDAAYVLGGGDYDSFLVLTGMEEPLE